LTSIFYKKIIKISEIIFALEKQYDIIKITLGEKSLKQKRRIHMPVKRKKATKKKAAKKKVTKKKATKKKAAKKTVAKKKPAKKKAAKKKATKKKAAKRK